MVSVILGGNKNTKISPEMKQISILREKKISEYTFWGIIFLYEEDYYGQQGDWGKFVCSAV